MNAEYYTYLLANPQHLTSEDAGKLETILQKYPYFQSARALQLKILKDLESYRYNDALKLAAAHTTDRDILFEYITSDHFIQNEISQNILEHRDEVEDIEVLSENISEAVTKEEKELISSEKRKAHAILDPNLFQNKSHSEPETESTEKKIEAEIDKPLEFTEADTYSFSEWLKLTKAKPIEREDAGIEKEREETDDSKNKKLDLIDRFIREQPKIRPNPEASTDVSKTISEQISTYSQAPDALMTETLARVYLQQKNYKKAIQAYKILILKNPEKSGYFADQIRAIEKIINPEQS